MDSILSIYLFIISSVIVVICLMSSSLARNKARDEMYKRKVVEYKYKHCKTLYTSKEKVLQYNLEAKEHEIKSLILEKKMLQSASEKDLILLTHQDVETKYLIESKDNKIEAQNAKITLLQADCTRLQRELNETTNNEKEC